MTLAPVSPDPLEDLQMPPDRGPQADVLFSPRAAISPGSFQNLQLPFLRGREAGALLPGAPVRSRPL